MLGKSIWGALILLGYYFLIYHYYQYIGILEPRDSMLIFFVVAIVFTVPIFVIVFVTNYLIVKKRRFIYYFPVYLLWALGYFGTVAVIDTVNHHYDSFSLLTKLFFDCVVPATFIAAFSAENQVE